MKLSRSKLITSALIASVSTYAFAIDRGGRFIDRLDTDGDNLISLEEFRFPGGRGSMLLEKADLNGDGQVTVDEALQANTQRMAEQQKKLPAKLTAIDANSDGVITAEEIREHAFSRLDGDNDGFLSAEEFNRAKHHDRKRLHRHERSHHSSE